MRLLLQLVLLALVTNVCLAGNTTQAPADPFAEILELSGGREALGQFPALLDAEIQRRAAGGDPSVAVIGPIMKEAFSAETLTATVLAFLRSHLPKDQVSSIMDLLRSPINARITQLEVEAATPAGQERMRKYAESLQASPPAPGRLQLCERLQKAGGLTDMFVAGALIVYQGLMTGAAEVSQGRLRRDESVVNRELRQIETQLRQTAEQSTLIQMLFTYRSASEAELEEYVRLMESPTGRSLTQVLANSVLVALRRASADAGGRLAKPHASHAPLEETTAVTDRATPGQESPDRPVPDSPNP